MRMIFITDPYVIRGRWDVTSWVAREYYKMLSAEGGGGLQLECKILCNRKTAQDLIQDGADADSFVCPSPASQRFEFNGSRSRWDDQDVEAWGRYLSGRINTSSPLTRLLTDIRAEFPFDHIVYWGTNRPLREYARRQNIPVLFCELGPLRPPFGFAGAMDPYGVNGDAFPTQVHVSGLDSSFGNPGTIFETVGSRTDSGHFLVPLQNADDVNVTLHGYGTQYEEFIIQSVETLRLNNLVTVAPHPGAYRYMHTFRKQSQLVERLAALHNVRILDRTDRTSDVLPHVNGTVAFNSSVGFEGILHCIPTTLGGRASYALGGVSTPLHDMVGKAFRPTVSFDRYLDFLERYYVNFQDLFTIESLVRGFDEWKGSEKIPPVETLHRVLEFEPKLVLSSFKSTDRKD